MARLKARWPLRVLLVALAGMSFVAVYIASGHTSNGTTLSGTFRWNPETHTSEFREPGISYFQVEDAVLRNQSLHLIGKAAEVTKPSEISHSGRQITENSRSLLDISVGSLRNFLSAIEREESRAFPWKPVKVEDVDCSRILAGDKRELERAAGMENVPPVPELTSENITRIAASSCSAFVTDHGFINDSLTEQERNFPIAFSVLVFKDPGQVLNLLRAIYRPQNYYCIHVDNKSNSSFRDAMKAIAGCFPNVFLSSRSVDVKWGTFTVLEPELICMQDLWNYTAWKYFINLTGQEFPLKTNYELVRILTAYNGANDLEGTVKRANTRRWAGAGLPPHNLRPVKGSVHVVVNRHFVDYMLHSKVARDFLEWCRKIEVPDETFFATLNHNPQLGISGTYKGEPETHPVKKPFLTRYKNWGVEPYDYPCAGGMRVRMICILTVGDLPFLVTRRELFANKFYQSKSRYALGCLGEYLYNRTRDEFLGNLEFDKRYYETLPFVRKMVTEPANRLRQVLT